ncbi:MAG: LysM peptidoglycan-binding domain-containing protein [Flavobacteriaceae bacterium]|nr:LysM peptidoglycan-binding domain-containing protein [Flavobacteriaceae bacterium]
MKNNITLLILLFILQISCKEGELSSFGIMNSKIEESIEIKTIANSTYLDVIYSKAKNDDSYIKYKESANKVHEISDIFSKYLEDLKNVIKEKNTTQFVDEYFFNGLEIANGGEEFLNYIESYKSSLIATLALSNPDIVGMVKSTFDIGSIKDRRGQQTNWLTLNYKKFPAIASIIKLSEMQTNVKLIEKTYYESILNVRVNNSELINQKSPVATNTEEVDEKSKKKIKEDTLINKEVKIKPKKKEEVKIKPKKKEEEKKNKKPKTKIKKKTTTVTTNPAEFHTVKKGETIYLISKKHKITTAILKKMNGMTNNNLVVGQKLKISKK